MSQTRALVDLLKHPRLRSHSFIRRDTAPTVLLQQVVLPAVAIRALAIMLRSAVIHVWGTGVVLAVSSVVLQVGTWALLALILRPLAHSFAFSLTEKQSYLMATALCAPLWLAGILFAVPEDPPGLLIVNRFAVAGIAAYGLLVFLRCLETLPGPKQARHVLLVGTGAAYLGIYVLLFVFLGILANVVLIFAS